MELNSVQVMLLDHYDGGSQTGYEACFSNLSAGIYTLNIRENIAVNPYD